MKKRRKQKNQNRYWTKAECEAYDLAQVRKLRRERGITQASVKAGIKASLRCGALS